MQPASSPAVALARRLRDLRLSHWPTRRVTQQQLAEALGGDRPLSEALISSWESTKHPVAPPDARLNALARFYATQRSLSGGRPRLLPDDELTEDERLLRDGLAAELMSLRHPKGLSGRVPLATSGDTIGGGLWHLRDGRPITIVCARLPPHMLKRMPYTDPNDPDYVRLYTFADLDSLLELHGHVRAVNPTSQVHIRAADELAADDLTTHLVFLGGLDWNEVLRDLTQRLQLPVRQQTRTNEAHRYDACFETGEGPERREFRPVLTRQGSIVTLLEDVAYFFRGINPLNAQRTVTICNGMFGRGTYGAVRALTDAGFRDRNGGYVSARFSGAESFSVLARVPILNGETVTPDWTVAENRLHEWPEMAA